MIIPQFLFERRVLSYLGENKKWTAMGVDERTSDLAKMDLKVFVT